MASSDNSQGVSPRIELAHEPSVRLGRLLVEPGLRRVVRDDGQEEFLEPRVMQLFVAFLRAEGRILSRDELIVSCWEGRIVGDDAINRTLSRLRRVAEGLGESMFKIETIAR
ncbi:winged helix-turn-helix domain-containing protein, partial [Sphingomonas sp.]|uniref:winged helix-turn-helix domain-containing protein n=1 Tax=Sphingomonas sp. TaxID=28214 RepID=UPI00286CB628